jgi:hypothetical protein
MKSQDSLSIGFDSLLFHPSPPYGPRDKKGKITNRMYVYY